MALRVGMKEVDIRCIKNKMEMTADEMKVQLAEDTNGDLVGNAAAPVL